MIGNTVHNQAAVVLRSLGGDATDFAARQLTAKIASSADLILTMTKAHQTSVLELAPRLLRRTFTLIEASRLVSECDAQTIEDLATLRPQLAPSEVRDISDPIGQTAKVFQMVGSQIAELVPPVLQLCRRSSELPA